jgi:antitoxin component YwqK of YwqJK toxin-antitoxin module
MTLYGQNNPTPNALTKDSLRTGLWTIYNSNGSIYARGKYVNGKRDSVWNFYYTNGRLMAHGGYVNGDLSSERPPLKGRDGRWEHYYQDGRFAAVNYWNKGLPSDTASRFTEFFDDGVLKSVKVFDRGPKDCAITVWQRTGDTMMTGRIRNGMLAGHWVLYNYGTADYEGDMLYDSVNGCPAKHMKGISGDTKCKDGEWIAYSGSPKYVYRREHYKNGKRDGSFITYLDDGTVLESKEWKDGKVVYPSDTDKTAKDAAASGSSSVHYMGGGEIVSYDEQGLVHGKYTHLGGHGRERTDGQMEHGKKTGKWVQYDENLNIRETGSYENDLKEGPYRFYDIDPYHLLTSGTYLHGMKKGKWTFFSSDSDIYREGVYQNDTATGVWTFMENGWESTAADAFRRAGNENMGSPYEEYLWSLPIDVDFAVRKKYTVDYTKPGPHYEMTGTYANGKPWFESRLTKNGWLHVKGYYPFGGPFVELIMDTIYDSRDREHEYRILNFWDSAGIHQVIDGNGTARNSIFNGQYYQSAAYKNGILDGEFIAHNKKGAIAQDIIYEKGKKVFIKLYREDYPEYQHAYWTFSSLPGGRHVRRSYDLRDTLLFESYGYGTLNIHASEDDDSLKYFYEGGRKSTEFFMKKGYKRGAYREYYYSGKIKSRGFYGVNGLTGAWVRYYEDGPMIDSSIYMDGKRNGLFVSYYASGKKHIEGQYSKDKKNGKWNTYNEKGELIKMETYLDGNLVQ